MVNGISNSNNDRLGRRFIREAQIDDREFIATLIPELLAFGSPPQWRDAQQATTIVIFREELQYLWQ